VELFAVRADPGLGEAREPNRATVAAMDEVRPFAGLGRPPFIIAVRRDQAAPPFHRVLEGRFLVDRLRPRVDQEGEFTDVLDPGRQQAPAHQPKMPDAVFDDYHWDWLGRRNIMSWREIGLLDIAKNLPQGLRRGGDYEASAHSLVQIGIDSA